jgi:hypothetical protein
MMPRARLIAVVLTIACGALGVTSSTQTWLHVRLAGSAAHDLTVNGAAAIPVLAPLSLALLALGAALSIVGVVLRYVFGGLALVIGLVQAFLAGQVAVARPVSAVARTVTDATGITGSKAVAELVADVTETAWAPVTLVVWIALCAVAVFVLTTARRWGAAGRKYRTDTASRRAGEQLDAVDSWDGLSRGEDPTGDPDPR